MLKNVLVILVNRTWICMLLLIFIFFACFYFYPYEKTSEPTEKKPKSTSSLLLENKLKSNQDIQNRLDSRLLSVQESCRYFNFSKRLQLGNLKKNEWPWIYVSHSHRFLYCQTPKVGSTNWLRVIQLLEGIKGGRDDDSRSVHNYPFLLLSHLDEIEQEKVLRRYRKFMVVRDPLERMLSAYSSKFVPDKNLKVPLFQQLSENIVERYRSSESSLKQRHPTLEEFAAFVTDKNQEEEKIRIHYSEPRHWLPQNKLCYPCDIEYDFILNMNVDFNEESNYLLSTLGVPFAMEYPSRHRSEKLFNEAGTKLTDSQRYLSLLNSNYLNALYEYYEKDYQIFGADILFQPVSETHSKV